MPESGLGYEDAKGLSQMFKRGMVAALLCGLVVGCGSAEKGPKTVHVEGTVEFDGEPIESGEILLRATDGGASGAARIVDGHFELDSTLGAKRVEITARRSTGKSESLASGETSDVSEQYVPKKFNEDSKLTLEVGEKMDAVSFKLTSS